MMEDQEVYLTKNNGFMPGDVLLTLRDEITKCISKYEEFRESYWTTCKQVEDALSDADRGEFYRVFTKVIDSTVTETGRALSRGNGFINGLIIEDSLMPT